MAAELYGIHNWSASYFDVSDAGEVSICLKNEGIDTTVSLIDIITGVKERGLELPVLLRISNILDSRIRLLNEAFRDTMEKQGYTGCYRGIYPIKVNQQQHIIEEITQYGKAFHHGLEAGSKAELIAAISFMNDPEAYLICNGYKDEEFVELGLNALRIGIRCVFVLETPSELKLVLEQAKRMDVRPIIGVRMKLSSKVSGHWTESGGDNSVFGLNTSQVIDIVDELKREGMLDCLQLLHYHLGSQVPNIRDIRFAVAEGCRIYAGLVNEGAPMGLLDLGGGLAVDYDGSHTNFTSSSNYTLQEYCFDVVEVVMSTLDQADVPHPTILTESGRAIVAYHSVLLFNVLDISRFETHTLPGTLPENVHEQVKYLMDAATSLSQKNVQECVNDALYYRDEIRQLFRHGAIGLRERGLAEQIFWNLAGRASREIKKMKYVPEDLQGLETALADTYYCNFSVFQSLPDAWAIEQLFPVIPLHRLNERPIREAILADITCDCDGKIDHFIDLHDVKRTLRVHEINNDEEYYLGAFLVGAYQETLGDLHNLLGDTNVVGIRIDESGHVHYTHEMEGDSVADVLSYVEYDTKAMIARIRSMAEQAVRKGTITPTERRNIMQFYETGLRGYTYFEK
ncbi:MAG: biosynthetic arginine decarboxylase [Spartobacteria bacterium]|nr:biosynthetic arginine decarboxylase [Spartobacteria bacterium]